MVINYNITYEEYFNNGGRLSREKFEEIKKYEPTIAETSRVIYMSNEEYKILFAKVYHVMESLSCSISDPLVYCECLAFTGQLQNLADARFKEEKERKMGRSKKTCNY